MARPVTVVADAGPLIGLARVGELDLLRRLFGTVLVSETVRDEILPAMERPGKAALAEAPDNRWLVVEPSGATLVPLNPGVDAGEASAIGLALARQPALLLIDDAAGRLEAKARGLQVMGLAGVIGLAKRQTLIPLAKPLLERLAPAGYYIGDGVISAVLKAVGE